MCPCLVETLVSYNPWIQWLWLVKLRSKRERLIVNWSRIFSFNTLYRYFISDKEAACLHLNATYALLNITLLKCDVDFCHGNLCNNQSLTGKYKMPETQKKCGMRDSRCAWKKMALAQKHRQHHSFLCLCFSVFCFLFFLSSVLRVQANARKLRSLFSYHHSLLPISFVSSF